MPAPAGKMSVTDALDAIYADVDPQVEEFAKSQNVTCRKGCSHCCTLLAIITIADGFYLAKEILDRADWREWIPKLVAASKKFCVPGITKSGWFLKQEPCVFLNSENACSFYAKRPAACRFHMVITPPENCGLGATNPETAMLDLVSIEAETSWKVALQMSPEPFAAPIPLMALYSMALLASQEYKDRTDEIVKAAEGLPTPNEWMMTYGESLFTDAAKVLDERERKGEVGLRPW